MGLKARAYINEKGEIYELRSIVSGKVKHTLISKQDLKEAGR